MEELLEADKLGVAFPRKIAQNYVTDINLNTYQHDLGNPTIRRVITLFDYQCYDPFSQKKILQMKRESNTVHPLPLVTVQSQPFKSSFRKSMMILRTAAQ